MGISRMLKEAEIFFSDEICLVYFFSLTVHNEHH